MKYTAKMKHNADTITKLVVMQYSTFQFGKKFIRIILALVLIIYGMLFLKESMVTPILAMFLGCMLISGVNVRAKHNANLLIKQMNGHYPSSDYYFSEKGFKDSINSTEIPYSKLIKLIDDKNFLYLYISTESAYMVDNSTVKGEGGLEGLKNLISEKSSLKWSKPVNFLNFSINSFRNNKNGNNNSDRGPRLGDRRLY